MSLLYIIFFRQNLLVFKYGKFDFLITVFLYNYNCKKKFNSRNFDFSITIFVKNIGNFDFSKF